MRCNLLAQSRVTTIIMQSTTTTSAANTEGSQQTLPIPQFLVTRLNDPKMSETEYQPMECELTDCAQELLLSNLVQEESLSSDKDKQGRW